MSDVRTLTNASTVDNIRSIFGNAVSRYVGVEFRFDFLANLLPPSLLKNTGYANFSCLQGELHGSVTVAVIKSSPLYCRQ